jgi:hypothetical protein
LALPLFFQNKRRCPPIVIYYLLAIILSTMDAPPQEQAGVEEDEREVSGDDESVGEGERGGEETDGVVVAYPDFDPDDVDVQGIVTEAMEILRRPGRYFLSFRRFEGDGRGRGHLQGVAGGGETVAFAGRRQQAAMADALEAGRPHVLQEAVGAGDADHPLAAVIVGCHASPV